MKKTKQFIITVLSSLLLSLLIGTSSFAQGQFTVADVEMVLYTTSEGAVLSAPDAASVVIPKEAVEDGLPIQVTGITSNQFFRVNLGDGNVYYMAANGLVEVASQGGAEVETSGSNSSITSREACYPTGKTATSFQYEYETPDGCVTYMQIPFVVNGIDIRNGDIDGDGISENHQNTWYDGRIWMASNTVVIKVADGFYMNPGNMNVYSIFSDGTENIRPGSPFMIAYGEFTGRSHRTEISAANLPEVIPVATKQTSINPDYPSFVAYRKEFDPLWKKQNTGSEKGLSILQPFDADQDGTCDGIGLVSMVGVSGYMWTMKYDEDEGYWVLNIKSNYTELIWDSIHNSIRMVTPDADAVFKEVFESYYGGNSVLYQNGGNWIKLGNTHLMANVKNGYLYYIIA